MSNRNTTPKDIWEVLQRLLNCNKQDLAKRLGIGARQLSRWREAEPNSEIENIAQNATGELLIATLRAANHADALAQWKVGKISK